MFKVFVLLFILLFTFSEGAVENGEDIRYYKNGKIESKGNYKDGKLNGEYIEYFKNGNVAFKGNYIDGKLNGESIIYNEDGGVSLKRNYKDDKRNGESIEYYNDGKVKEKANFKDDKRVGESIKYYRSGTVDSKVNYKEDKKVGETRYYENGKIKSKGNYKEGKLNGEFIEYFDNGKVASKVKYIDGKLNGEGIGYYDNGKVYSKQNYKEGVLVGEKILYHENGKVYVKQNYKDGEFVGEGIEYYHSGEVRAKVSYKGGKRFGEYIEYYKNGKVRAKVNYSNGKRFGEYIEYYENEKVKVKQNYLDDMENGDTEEYYPSGKTMFTYSFRKAQKSINGVKKEFSSLDGDYILYYENGKPWIKEKYKEGNPVGEIEEYSDGKDSITIKEEKDYPHIAKLDKTTIALATYLEVYNKFMEKMATIMVSDSDKQKNYEEELRKHLLYYIKIRQSHIRGVDVQDGFFKSLSISEAIENVSKKGWSLELAKCFYKLYESYFAESHSTQSDMNQASYYRRLLLEQENYLSTKTVTEFQGGENILSTKKDYEKQVTDFITGILYNQEAYGTMGVTVAEFVIGGVTDGYKNTTVEINDFLNGFKKGTPAKTKIIDGFDTNKADAMLNYYHKKAMAIAVKDKHDKNRKSALLGVARSFLKYRDTIFSVIDNGIEKENKKGDKKIEKIADQLKAKFIFNHVILLKRYIDDFEKSSNVADLLKDYEENTKK